MFHVYFFQNRSVLLHQFRKHVPSAGENITIKGRKGKVESVKHIDEKNVHVRVVLDNVNKNKLIIDTSKKKKR